MSIRDLTEILNHLQSEVDLGNSTYTPLIFGGSFGGIRKKVENFSTIHLTIRASSNVTVEVQHYTHGGSIDLLDSYTILANTGFHQVIPMKTKYYSILIINTGANQTYLNVQTIISKYRDSSFQLTNVN